MKQKNSKSGKLRRGKFGFVQKRKRKSYGALDLGTNNCRLLIARPTGSGFRVVASYSKIVRLGEGLSANGCLRDDAMSRTIEALSVCAERLNEFDVAATRSIATEACRRAGNCDEFFSRVRKKTGLDFEAIPYEEEARLALVGCRNLLDGDAPNALVFDIGGGSTELIWAERDDSGAFEIIDVISLPFGVVTLAEKCGTDIVDPESYEEMVAEVSSWLPPFCEKHQIGKRVGKGLVQMLGTSGTVTTLSAVHLKLPYYSRSKIDGLAIDFDSLTEASKLLTDLDYENRAAVPCIGRERAELVIPGCAILDAICRSWPVGQLKVADRGLREGMLMELMQADGIPISGNPAAVDRNLPPRQEHVAS